MTEETDDTLTAVIISFRKNRHNHRLIFGSSQFEIRRGWHRKLAVFSPGQCFGYERWRGDKYGTQHWSFIVCETVKSGVGNRIPGIMPGAKLLLNVRGKTRVKRAFSCLDHLKEMPTPLEFQPKNVWRELHHHLLTESKDDQFRIEEGQDILW